MKKLIITIIVALLGMGAASAQESKVADRGNLATGMSYRDLKDIYNYTEYKTFDFSNAKKKYSIAGNGFASFFIPGLGQWIAGEGGLGCAFFFPALASDAIMGLGAFMVWGGHAAINYDGTATEKFFGITNGVLLVCLGLPLIIIGSVGLITVDILSIKNAVRVSKVKNMYYDDLQRKDFGTNFDLKLTPYMDVLAMHSSNLTPVAGLSLKLNF